MYKLPLMAAKRMPNASLNSEGEEVVQNLLFPGGWQCGDRWTCLWLQLQESCRGLQEEVG